jgi:hypothetical protein
MKKIIIGCLGAIVLVAVVLVVVVCFWVFHKSPLLDATMTVPLEAELESPVKMVITVTNTNNTPVTLDSIDVSDSFLSGFQVVTIDPKATDTTHVPILKQRSWDFGKPISPGRSLSVTFELKPVKEGRFSGDVDVCNPNLDSTTVLADVVVKKQHSQKTLEATQSNSPHDAGRQEENK